MASKLILGYWGIQGIGQIPRYLLEYLQIPYENKMYFEDEEWAKDKESLGLDFPNLPYIINGDFKLTESQAILRWIPVFAKKNSLLGENEKDQAFVSMQLGVLVDVMQSFFKAKYPPKENGEEVVKTETAKLKAKFAYLSKYLGNKEWLVGYLTVADFMLCHSMDAVKLLDENFFAEFGNLRDLHERFFKIEQIKSFKESDRCPKDILPPF